MVYKKNFVACIKVGGQILRESNDRVELPFGSEYSILLKNLDSVRMQARISIDGKDATGWVIVNPNQDVEVERFIEDLTKGNRFKFIERTERIEQHRGIKPEDGLVRIEFKREKVYEAPKVVEHHTYHNHYRYYGHPWYSVYPGQIIYTSSSGLAQAGTSFQGLQQNTLSAQNSSVSRGLNAMSMTRSAETTSFNDSGITVPGSISEQKFYSVSGFETEQAEVLVLHLVGKNANEPVKIAKTVKTKISCEICGKKNKSNAKFCIECGTSLQKV